MVIPTVRQSLFLALVGWVISVNFFAIRGHAFVPPHRVYESNVRIPTSTAFLRTQTRDLASRREAVNVKRGRTCLRDCSDAIVRPKSEHIRASIPRRSVLVKALLPLLPQFFFVREPVWATPSGIAAPVPSMPSSLTWRNLSSAGGVLLASCILLVGRWNQTKLAQDMALACLRCFLQLQLLGGLVLTQYLVLSQSHLSLVLFWVGVTGMLAAVEASSRVDIKYPRMVVHVGQALLTGGGSVLGAAAALRVFGDLKPWFSPRTWIPVSGMLYGNAVTACGIALSTLTRELVARRGLVEWRLSRGASWREALKAPLRLVFTTALTPIINALSVTGLVHLPGMMTGQILAGQSPYQAASYQVLIFFMIAASVIVSVQTLISLAVREFVDATNDRLVTVETVLGTGPSSVDSKAMNHTSRAAASPSLIIDLFRENITILHPDGVTDWSSKPVDRKPVFRVDKMLVERTGVQVSMELFSGDRIGIKGPSGVGKSQVLRTICGLENFDRSSVFLRDECAMEIPMPEWRRRVSLVVQDRPSLEGTPRECFYELSDYKSARNVALGDPCYLVTSWGFESSILDQSWSALSGGEAQVAALALTLSLKPEVLLLDESTNALDDASAIKVEKTIASMKIPAILVSHAEVQLDRFCTSIVNFNDRPRETAGPSGSTFRQCVSS